MIYKKIIMLLMLLIIPIVSATEYKERNFCVNYYIDSDIIEQSQYYEYFTDVKYDIKQTCIYANEPQNLSAYQRWEIRYNIRQELAQAKTIMSQRADNNPSIYLRIIIRYFLGI